MSCASKRSVLFSALLLAFLPFIWVLQARDLLLRLLLRPIPTQTAFRRRRKPFPLPSHLIASRGAMQGHAGFPDDDFDPEHDDWVQWLDEPHVIEACIPHLNRCLDLEPGKHHWKP